ncbi:hypothetical protein [Levilactobacillus spicheri]|uniref:Uncharacterized protein n=1 Tax=Levilactobacillus spicheri TaxID=216463 RepID=A0ABQ0WLS0_9LACO|nr:hypothetical protein [Levilactobacillus spicheri]GEO65749.1 hypothetical protein LSP04_01680 [Levilactobacillus spicheri]
MSDKEDNVTARNLEEMAAIVVQYATMLLDEAMKVTAMDKLDVDQITHILNVVSEGLENSTYDMDEYSLYLLGRPNQWGGNYK